MSNTYKYNDIIWWTYSFSGSKTLLMEAYVNIWEKNSSRAILKTPDPFEEQEGLRFFYTFKNNVFKTRDEAEFSLNLMNKDFRVLTLADVT